VSRVAARTEGEAADHVARIMRKQHAARGDAINEIERVLARAATVQLARAIFKAAQGEHPQRRITLCKDNRVVSDSNG
jgi:hypothetical protein